MSKSIEYRLPVMTIKEVKPTLYHEGILYASTLIATIGKKEIKLYETNGIDYTDLIDKEVECLIEITSGAIEYDNNNNDSNFIQFSYYWDRMPTVFFPELVSLVEGEERTGFHTDKDAQDFEELAIELFANWSKDGLGLGYDKRKPMLHSDWGIFLLNEYQFEKDIENWELEEEVYIKIKEAYLRGIRPYVPQEAEAEKPQLTEAQKAELERRRAQQERSRIAYEEMQERIKQRRASGEGPSLLV